MVGLLRVPELRHFSLEDRFAENEIFGDIVWLKNSFPLGTGNGQSQQYLSRVELTERERERESGGEAFSGVIEETEHETVRQACLKIASRADRDELAVGG